jgi:predicted hotdog family 3-hydroxylacyl-ACP dehydratase
MASSGMLRRVALVRTDDSEELSTSFIRVTRIGELGTTLAVTSNRRALRGNPSDLLGFLHNVRRLLVTASVVPSSPILVTLKKEALSSTETSIFARATR